MLTFKVENLTFANTVDETHVGKTWMELPVPDFCMNHQQLLQTWESDSTDGKALSLSLFCLSL